jgi:hypothetical protein
MFFVAKNTGKNKFVKSRGHPDIDFLENYLIGMALEKNPDLGNKANSKILERYVCAWIDQF